MQNNLTRNTGVGGGRDGGAGDVTGPASSTDNAVVRFDGMTGKVLQNSGVIISDSDDLDVPGRLAAGSDGIIGTSGGVARIFDFSHTLTDLTPGTTRWDIFKSNIILNAAANYTNEIYSSRFDVQIPNTNTRNYTFVSAGLGAYFAHNGSGTIGSAFASGGIFENAGSGVVSSGDGFDVYSFNSGSGSITTNTAFYTFSGAFAGTVNTDYTIYVASPANTGVVNTHYGIYLADQSVGAGTSYTIYSAGSRPSYHLGHIGVGRTTATARLDIHDTTNTTPIIRAGNSGTAHGMTGILPTDTFFELATLSATTGGSRIRAISEGDNLPLQISGYVGNAVPTSEAIRLSCFISNGGTGATGFSSSGTLLRVFNNTTEALRLNGDGKLAIGSPTSNPTYMMELVSAAGSAAAANIGLRDLDVSHPVTSILQANTFFHVGVNDTNDGGALITAITDADNNPLTIRGIFGINNPTDTRAAVNIIGAKWDSTTFTTGLGSSETVFAVWNSDISGTPLLSILGSGNAAISGGLTVAGNIGFFGTTAAAQQTSGANLTNNVTSGGTNDTIANFTDLTTYSNDAATIRNNIYQLARKLKQVNDALRVYGLLT